MELHKLGIGTVQFGLDYGISNELGKTSEIEVEKILDLAFNKGIRILDTAIAYGNAEEIIGKYNHSRFDVVSKFMPVSETSKIRSQLNETLKNIKEASIYGYMAHRPLSLTDKDWKELQLLKKEGKIQKVGYSLNKPEEIDLLLEKGFFPDIIQAPYNYFDRRFENQLIELKNKGVEIHTRSVFLQGLFFCNTDLLDNYFNEVKPLINNLQENFQPLANNLLNFVLERDFIDKVIIGVENEDQLNNNLIESKTQLPDLNTSISDNIIIPSNWTI